MIINGSNIFEMIVCQNLTNIQPKYEYSMGKFELLVCAGLLLFLLELH